MAVQITYFVHGTTLDNERSIATGWLPGELSPKGIEQATDLGRQLREAGRTFDTLFCSDLARAVDSARLMFGEDAAIEQEATLRECNYGDNNGKPDAFKDDMTLFIDTPFPNGESYRDVGHRVRNFLQILKLAYDGQHIAIVAHQAPQLALEVALKGKTWEQAIAEDWRHTHSWQPGWEYILP